MQNKKNQQNKKKNHLNRNRQSQQKKQDEQINQVGCERQNSYCGQENKKSDGIIPEELFENFRERMVRMVFEHGRDICTIGEEPDGVYFLQEGTAEVLDGEGAQINIMHEGQYFGEYAVLAHQRNGMSMQAFTDHTGMSHMRYERGI